MPSSWSPATTANLARGQDRGRARRGAGRDFVFGSHDGRYVDGPPRRRAGRLPTGQAEIAVSVSAAKAEDLEIGDVIPLAFWPRSRRRLVARRGRRALGRGDRADRGGTPDRGRVSPCFPMRCSRTSCTAVHRAIVSPDVARRYDCLPPAPVPSPVAGREPRRQLPTDCAVFIATTRWRSPTAPTGSSRRSKSSFAGRSPEHRAGTDPTTPRVRARSRRSTS